MELETGNIYFYQDNYFYFWIKPFRITRDAITCISSRNIQDLKGVDISNRDNFLEKIIANNDGRPFMKYSNLDKPFKGKSLFKSYRDEINKDFSGDESLFLRCNKLHVEWSDKNFKYDHREIRITNLKKSICISYDDFKRNYSGLDYTFVIGGVCVKRAPKTFVRDYYINKILNKT